MVDFITIVTKSVKKDVTEVYPKFVINRKSKDLMIRGGDFYAVWLEGKGMWSTDEQDAIDLIDDEVRKFYMENKERFGGTLIAKYLWDAESGMIDKWHKYCQKQMRDNYVPLDSKIIFANDPVNKEDYASHRLSYPLEDGKIDAWNKIIGTLYSEEERHKIEWCIGSIVTGDSRWLQKFLVFYGAGGTGKSTILNIIEELFDGYHASFSSKALASNNNSFALEPFKNNPLVAIEHEGDLSRIEDNTKLNSLVSHETMSINNKFEKLYTMRFNSFIILASNKPVKITDAKSGLIRRLIDVHPTGNLIPEAEYNRLIKQIKFELGAIAFHCKNVYLENPGYYNAYKPEMMMGETNEFYNFVIDKYLTFSKAEYVTLNAAWDMYKEYIADALIQYPYPKMRFKTELKNYFDVFEERYVLEDGTKVRNYYAGFRVDQFVEKKPKQHVTKDGKLKIVFKEQKSIFDKICADCIAQVANKKGTPPNKWIEAITTLKDIDTHLLHYVKVPINHIVIDFDLMDENGEKSLERNIEAASLWPPTYAELSKSGKGIHLHYIYTGDVSKLSHIYEEHIEIKTFGGGSSLRRMLTKCNDLPIATISSGLPLKGEEKMVNFDKIHSERALRTLIMRSLHKEYQPGTKPSMEFIKKVTDDAYDQGLIYDVSDLKPAIISFAANSTHHSEYCMSLCSEIKWKNEAEEEEDIPAEEGPLVMYDVEVFPNLFITCWGEYESTMNVLDSYNGDIMAAWDAMKETIVTMINPSGEEIEDLCKFRIVGFNNRKYDNHILYARMQDYSNYQLYKLSKKLIEKKKGYFNSAYNLGYTDIWDYATSKQGLKKWEIALDIHHQELGLPWDEPVPEELWEKVGDYCRNDVLSTMFVWRATQDQFTARQILADLAGGTVNMTTNTLTTKIISGGKKEIPLVYTDFATGKSTDGKTHEFNKFEGYEYIPGPENKGKGRNMYRGDDLGFGGWNLGKPGIYYRVKTFDVGGEHPASARALNAFGDECTKRFGELVDLRLAIKHKDYEKARTMLDGKAAKYLEDESSAKVLAAALKLAVNSVYGLTAATFDHPLRDPRNKNNIVALRGALFMRTLKDEIEQRGFEVISIKTDSCKVVDPDEEIEKFIFDFGKKYGYEFEVENVFEKICLVNVSTFIAKCAEDDPDTPGKWKAKADQFSVPYLFKTLFSHEPIIFKDKCEVFSVKEGDIWIDMNEGFPDVSEFEKELKKAETQYKKGELSDMSFDRIKQDLEPKIAKGHNYKFVGRVGQFCPMKPGTGGGVLYRIKDGQRFAVQGTKGYRWLESEVVRELGKEDDIDVGYYHKLIDKAVDAISQYGDFEAFVAD